MRDSSYGNPGRILRFLFLHGPATRAAVARGLSLTRTAMTELVGSLIEGGLVEEEEGTTSGGRGRPGRLIRLRSGAAHFLGVEIGVERLVAVCDKDYLSEEDLLKLYSEAFAVYYAPHDEDYGFVTLEAKPQSLGYRPDEIELLGWAVQQIGMSLQSALARAARQRTGELEAQVRELERMIAKLAAPPRPAPA